MHNEPTIIYPLIQYAMYAAVTLFAGVIAFELIGGCIKLTGITYVLIHKTRNRLTNKSK